MPERPVDRDLPLNPLFQTLESVGYERCLHARRRRGTGHCMDCGAHPDDVFAYARLLPLPKPEYDRLLPTIDLVDGRMDYAREPLL